MIKQRTEMTEAEPQRKGKEQIAEQLTARIGRGEWAPGAQLPTVRELARGYDCAPNTITEALKILRAAGLIVMRQRQRSTVAITRRSVAGPVERLVYSRAGGLQRAGETAEILSVGLREAAINPDAAAVYGVAEDEFLGVREYVIRDADGVVNTYGRSFFSEAMWNAVAELREPTPIPDGAIGAIERAQGHRTVAVPTPRVALEATREEASALGVEVGSPVLIEVTECQIEDGTVVEWALYAHPAGYWVGR